MNRITIVIISLFTFHSMCSQELISYDDYIDKAEAYFEADDYNNANASYKKAFGIVQTNVITSDIRFDSAIAFALSNDKKSAYKQLFKIYKKGLFDGYTNYENIINEAAFEDLHQDKKWRNFIIKLKNRHHIATAKINDTLIQQLADLDYKDQKAREDFTKLVQNFSKESDAFKKYAKNMAQVDSLNFITFEKIMDATGWLGPEIVGEDGVNTQFLLVQHNNNLEVQKRYLPFIKKTVKKGKESPSHMAFLEDRIAMNSHQPQTYGTQFKIDENNDYYVWPIKNPETVNKRRIKIGLDTLEDYIKRVGLSWDVESHKENARKIFAKTKK